MEEHCKQQNEAISPLLTKEGSGKEAGEEPQKPNGQATNNSLPHPDPVYILPTPATHSTPETPTIKATPFALHAQNFRKLVAFVQTFFTTSKTMAATHIVTSPKYLRTFIIIFIIYSGYKFSQTWVFFREKLINC